MESIEFNEYPKVVQKNVMTCNGTPWNSQEFHGIPCMECLGSPNNPMKFHGISLKFHGSHESHGFHGYPNSSFWLQIREFHGIPVS